MHPLKPPLQQRNLQRQASRQHEIPMTDVFDYQNGELFAENVALSDLADQFGTPLYVYSRKAFSDSFLAYADALKGKDALVCYAVKANSNIAVLSVLAKLGLSLIHI